GIEVEVQFVRTGLNRHGDLTARLAGDGDHLFHLQAGKDVAHRMDGDAVCAENRSMRLGKRILAVSNPASCDRELLSLGGHEGNRSPGNGLAVQDDGPADGGTLRDGEES